jgi:hypothetical protein
VSATGGKKLLGDKDGKCRADSTTYDAVFMPCMMKNVQLGMVAGLAAVAAGASSGAQVPHNVAVRIKNADFRNGDVREPLLPSRFAQQVLGSESGRRFVTFVLKDRQRFCVTHMIVPSDSGGLCC